MKPLSQKAPLLFVSHQSPTQWDTPSASRSFLQKLGEQTTDVVQDILFVSAHWTATKPTVSISGSPPMIYDFGGFPSHYYDIAYPSRGAPKVAQMALEMLAQAGFVVEASERGLDHAVWLPAGLMYPQADKRIATLSVMPQMSPQQHIEVGQALAPLRDQGVAIIASGTLTHNLQAFFGSNRPALNGPVEVYVSEFSHWVQEAVKLGAIERLLDYRQLAPHAIRCHPTVEHILPLFVALGASSNPRGRPLHHSIEYGHFSMTSFAWD